VVSIDKEKIWYLFLQLRCTVL